MTVITRNYCPHCHKTPLNENNSIKSRLNKRLIPLVSEIATQIYITGKTFKAHPLTSALFAIALIAAVAAVAALMATGFGLIGFGIGAIGIDLLCIGTTVAYLERRNIKAAEYKKNHTLDKMTQVINPSQKVCLFIEAEQDTNGALRTCGPAKWEKKFPVIHIKVGSVDEVASAIERVSHLTEIHVLWISAHGNSGGIMLGKNSKNDLSKRIDESNVESLESSIGLLHEDAVIILNSCETAKMPLNPNSKNIAARISEVAQNRRVIASSECISRYDVRLKVKKDVKIGISTPKWGHQRATVFQKFSNRVCRAFSVVTPNFIGKKLKRDSMKVYQNGIVETKTTTFATF